jgi:hypothetical protein
MKYISPFGLVDPQKPLATNYGSAKHDIGEFGNRKQRLADAIITDIVVNTSTLKRSSVWTPSATALAFITRARLAGISAGN